MIGSIRVGIAATYLGMCIVLGGGSAGGAFGNGVLQLVAVLILLMLVWVRHPALASEGRWIVGIFLAFAAVAGTQLIPLPPEIWSSLPGRGVATRSFALLGVTPPDMPASLDPRSTFASLLWLLPPAAMFLLATRLTRDERSSVAKILLGGAVVSIVLGAFQLFGGSGSPLYFYEFTNVGRSVGFFANANHVATLMLCALPFAAMYTARARKGKTSGGARGGRVFIYAALALFIAGGIAVNGSLAGYAILVPTALASLLLFMRTSGRPIGSRTWLLVGASLALFVGLSLFGPLSGARLATKFDAANTTGRKISVPTTVDAAIDHFPIGSGLGTFRDLYRTYEPSENVTFVFVNHAHNDYAEIALELGLPGILLVFAFILWWVVQTVRAWRDKVNGAELARAGSIAIGVILIHSLVDYPARTSAIAAIMAMAAAFMVRPPPSPTRPTQGNRGKAARNIGIEAG